MMRAQIIADTLIALAAIAGLAILYAVLRRDGADPMARRFRFGVAVLAGIYAGRVAQVLTGGWRLAEIATVVMAAALPLAVVMIGEGLTRRHAPRAFKLVVLAGCAAVLLAAPFPPRIAGQVQAVLMFSAQLVAIAGTGWLVLRRDRASLSAGENWLADRVALSLLLILPLLVTDYPTVLGLVPVRLAGIAVLAICWLVIGLRRGPARHLAIAAGFAVMLTAAAIAGAGLAALAGLDWRGAVQTGAVVLAAQLLAAAFLDSQGLEGEARRQGLLRHIAYGREMRAADFLAGLRARLPVESALLLEGAALEDFDPRLTAAFDAAPILRRADLDPRRSASEDQAAALFQRHDATHLMLVGRDPLRILALNLPALAAGPGIETELRAVQRVAILISEREASQ